MLREHNWAVILAGGNGSRLQDFTRQLSGDDRPKQFCRLLQSQSLLSATRERIAPIVAPEHTLYVVTVHHERYYREEFQNVCPHQVIEQPINRGTTIAIATGIATARTLAGDAVLGFFPADHHYDDAIVLTRTLQAAYAAARVDRRRVFLIGAEADRAETEYGWIEPGRRLGATPPRAGGSGAYAVRGFVEKPSSVDAASLLARQCLWNTFVLVGQVAAFEALLCETAPGLYESAHAAMSVPAAFRSEAMAGLYTATRDSDFSRDVLMRQPDRLGVVRLPASGWTDLGQSSRLLQVMARSGLSGSTNTRAAS
jgi:mannose-1-phosphate guanylyltransferase